MPMTNAGTRRCTIDLSEFNARTKKYGQPITVLAFGQGQRDLDDIATAVEAVEDVVKYYYDRPRKSHYRRFEKLMAAGEKALRLGWKDIGFVEGINAPYITEKMVITAIELIIVSKYTKIHCKNKGISRKFNVKTSRPKLDLGQTMTPSHANIDLDGILDAMQVYADRPSLRPFMNKDLIVEAAEKDVTEKQEVADRAKALLADITG